MLANTHYRCDAWLVEDVLDSPSESVFLIDIYADIVPRGSAEEGDRETDGGDSTTRGKQFRVPRRDLIRDSMSWSTIVSMLAQMDLPFDVHPIMIQKIMACARESPYMDSKIVPMVVRIQSRRTMDTHLHRVESLELQGESVAHDNSSWVEVLEKVKAEDCHSKCVICLEDLLIGMEATRMPCLHVYHRTCIQNWLKHGNMCPLCRFQIPG